MLQFSKISAQYTQFELLLPCEVFALYVAPGSNCITIKKGAIKNIYYYSSLRLLFSRCRNIVERLINGTRNIQPEKNNSNNNNNTQGTQIKM